MQLRGRARPIRVFVVASAIIHATPGLARLQKRSRRTAASCALKETQTRYLEGCLLVLGEKNCHSAAIAPTVPKKSLGMELRRTTAALPSDGRLLSMISHLGVGCAFPWIRGYRPPLAPT